MPCEKQMTQKRIITSADEMDASIAGTKQLATYVCACREKAQVVNGVCLGCHHSFVSVWETDKSLSIYTVPKSSVAKSSAKNYLVKREVLCPYCAISVVKSDPASQLYDFGSPVCEACGSVVVPYCYVDSGVWQLHIVAKTGYDSFLRRATGSAPVVDKTLLNAEVEDSLEMLDISDYLERITRLVLTDGMTPTEIRIASVEWFVDVYIEVSLDSVLTRESLFESYEQAVVSEQRELPPNKRDKDLLLSLLRERYPETEGRSRLSKNVVSRYFEGLRLSEACISEIKEA